MNSAARVRVGLCSLLLACGLSGCWDQLTFTSRASALLITIAASARAGEWRWRFYFPNPTVTVSSLTQIKPKDQFYQVAVTADSLAQAYAKVQQRLARDLYLGQLQVIVWSSRIPVPTLASLLDAYNREGTVPKTAYMLLARPPLAQKVAVTPQEVIPSVYLTSYFDCQVCQPEYFARTVWQTWDDLVTPGISPIVPYMESPAEVAQIGVLGTAGPPILFSRRQTEGYAYLTGKVGKETLSLAEPGGRVTLTHVRETPVKTRVTLGRHAINVRARIEVSATLGQWPRSQPLTPRTVRTTEQAAARVVLGKCLAAIAEANRTHTDPFGYGRTILFMHPSPQAWPISADWLNYPIAAQVAVRVWVKGSGVSE
ncbi:MAG: spore gernimation protein GerC [Thermaerobacter sp.]|nr:spore gernimation protein GerC [Thermaerobacter sp.]